MQYEEGLKRSRNERRKALMVFTGALAIEAVDSTLLSTAPNIVKLAVGVISVGAAYCSSFPIAFSTLDIHLIKQEMKMIQSVPPLEVPDMDVQEYRVA